MKRDIRRDVRQKLIQVAKKENTITYGSLMRQFHIPRGSRAPGIGIGYVVGDISEYEASKGYPLLSAIVVRSGSARCSCPYGSPGGGFFGLSTIPARLKRPKSKHSDPVLTAEEAIFLRNEQNNVWKFWKRHNDRD